MDLRVMELKLTHTLEQIFFRQSMANLCFLAYCNPLHIITILCRNKNFYCFPTTIYAT